MIRNLIIVAVLISLTLLGIRWLLVDHRLISYIDQRADSPAAPEITYYIGDLFYTFQDYASSEAYFRYLLKRFPDSAYTERAHVMWLESMQYGFMLPPAQLIAECQSFLHQYPASPYASRVQNLVKNANDSAYNEIHVIQQIK